MQTYMHEVQNKECLAERLQNYNDSKIVSMVIHGRCN
jgi:hypothetical protein